MSIKIIINTPKTKYYLLAKSKQNDQWLYGGAVLKDSQNFSSIGIENLDIIEAHPSYNGGEISYSINS